MPKKIKNCFYEKLTFDKMYNAHLRAKRNKTYKKEVIIYEMNLENNIVNLIHSIRKNKYHLGSYRSFIIKEPKEREIKALPYKDRIVHQWYVEEFIKPYIMPRFIKDTFACIEERGAHKAVDTIQKYMQIYKRNNDRFWILKCDIRKFFYSIDPHILFEVLKKYIKDKKLLEFTQLLIFDNLDEDSIGIPIGNYTSQFFANIYLNELDQYIKGRLNVKYYVRYMDDFIILLKTKEECREYKRLIEIFCEENLKLELNDKSRYYPDKFGLNFCGYKIWSTHKLIRTNSKIKIKRNVKNWNELWKKNKLDFNFAIQSINSWFGHISHANGYKLKKDIMKKCEFIYKEENNSFISKR